MFVDWGGDTVPIYDRKTGDVTPASIFIAALGASNYTSPTRHSLKTWRTGLIVTCARSSFNKAP